MLIGRIPWRLDKIQTTEGRGLESSLLRLVVGGVESRLGSNFSVVGDCLAYVGDQPISSSKYSLRCTTLPNKMSESSEEEDYLSGLIISYEHFWVQHQPLLLSRGYKLRERYHPDWIPSWTQRPENKKTKPIKKEKCSDYIISNVCILFSPKEPNIEAM